MKHFALILFFAVAASAQIFPGRASKFRVLTSTPTTCAPGDVAFVIGDQTKVCNVADTWTNLGASVSAGVASFNSRTGAVNPANGDYAASAITNTPAGTISATTVQAALNELDAEKIASSINLATISALGCIDGQIMKKASGSWACAADDSSGGVGSSDGLTVTSTTTAITVASGGHCRIGNVRYEIPSAAVWTVSGAATGTVFVYCSIAGTTAQVTVGTTSGVGSCDADCTSQTLSSSGFPAGSAPIATVAMTAGVLSTTPADKRDSISAYHGIAGAGMGKSSNADGSETWNNLGIIDAGTGLIKTGTTAAVDSAVVPMLGTSNTYTNLNDFSAGTLRITSGTGVPSSSLCNASGHVGRMYARSNAAATNATLYVCSNTGSGTYAWELTQGAGGGGMKLLYSGSTKFNQIGASSSTYYGPGVDDPGGEAYRGFVAVGTPATTFCTANRITFVTTGAQPGDASLVFTLRINGSDTALVLTVAAGAAAGTYTATGSVTVQGNDIVSIRGTNNSASASAIVAGYGIGCQ